MNSFEKGQEAMLEGGFVCCLMKVFIAIFDEKLHDLLRVRGTSTPSSIFALFYRVKTSSRMVTTL